jgi:hypothetical protein
MNTYKNSISFKNSALSAVFAILFSATCLVATVDPANAVPAVANTASPVVMPMA